MTSVILPDGHDYIVVGPPSDPTYLVKKPDGSMEIIGANDNKPVAKVKRKKKVKK